MLKFHKINLVKLDFWIEAINLHKMLFFKSFLCDSSIWIYTNAFSFYAGLENGILQSAIASVDLGFAAAEWNQHGNAMAIIKVSFPMQID